MPVDHFKTAGCVDDNDFGSVVFSTGDSTLQS
jgi:hypothetical protein